MGIGETLRDLGRYVMYYPSLVPICGSVNATVFLCNLLTWDGLQRDPEGWIYKSREEMQDETGLTRSMQDGARQLLRDRGLIEERLRGVPATMHYRIGYRALEVAWETHLQTSLQENRKLDGGEPANRLAGKPQTISKKTPQKTQGVPSPRRDTGAVNPADYQPGGKYWHLVNRNSG